MLDWNDLRALGEVARHGSLAHAARALALHPTTVGRRIAAAEDELGQKLLLRHGRRGVSLTPAARQLVAAVVPLLDALGEVTRRAGRSASAPVRVAVTTNGARTLAARLPLGALAEEGLSVELVAGNRPVDLARGEADLAVRVLDTTDPSLVRRRLGAVRYGLFASEGYLRRRPVGDDLAGHLVLAPSLELAQGPEARWLAEHARGAEVRLRASDLVTLAEAAARGEGLVVLPGNLAVFHALRCVRRLAIEPRPVWLVYHRDQRGDRRVKRVAAAVADAMIAALAEEERVLA